MLLFLGKILDVNVFSAECLNKVKAFLTIAFDYLTRQFYQRTTSHTIQRSWYFKWVMKSRHRKPVVAGSRARDPSMRYARKKFSLMFRFKILWCGPSGNATSRVTSRGRIKHAAKVTVAYLANLIGSKAGF